MRKTKTYIRKISNVTLLGILLVIIIGIYFTIFNSKAEDVRLVNAIVQDIYGILEDEDVELEAKNIGNNEFSIQLPEDINTKIVKQYNEIKIETTVEDETSENTITTEKVLEIENNEIALTEQELNNLNLTLKVEYDMKTMVLNELGTYEKTEITTDNLEEQKALFGEREVVYNKLLKYEDTANEKVVEVRGFLPKDAELHIQEVSAEEIESLLENKTVTVAYDIKIAIPQIQEDETITYTYVNPSDYDENCEVKIESSTIQENSQIYHIDDEKQVEEVTVKENINEVVKFDANEFSTYAVVTDSEVNTASEVESTSETETINYLVSTAGETSSSSDFLNSSALNIVEITRSNVESVTFQNDFSGMNSGNSWSVDENGTGSIYAWYKDDNSNGYYEIYIGSTGTIYANPNSSYFFANMFRNTTGTYPVINNIELLDTSHVTNMSYMFAYCGYNNSYITELNLGTNFNTANVTNMAQMFCYCGYNGMSSLKLGNNFNTSKVTNMAGIFYHCGENTMTTLDLGPAFKNLLSNAYVFTNSGSSGNNTIYCASDIYSGIHAFKLNKDSTEMITYNTGYINLKYTNEPILKSAVGEGTATGGFLGNTAIQRQNIESVTFQEGFLGMTSDTSWIVDTGDSGSIMAWYKDDDSDGTYEVYIGSCETIYANPDSSYLFAFIGSGANCNDTSVINNIESLNTENVTNMEFMFQRCGATAMTDLDLGSNFITTKVINMRYMFDSCGSSAMINLKLGDNFDTSSVTNMTTMFRNCGMTSMTALSLGNKFDTSKVTDMTYMFYQCGKNAMETLDLGIKFTKIADLNDYFVTNCGKDSVNVIYCSEKIYQDINNFKLNENSETTINYVRGTINPKYTNTLKVAETATSSTSKFLGHATLQRQTIESITLQDSMTGIVQDTAWAVDINNTGSVMAWYKDTDGDSLYEVYIGTYGGKIKANENSSYLFAYIGYKTGCNDTSVIYNLALLDTSNVTNMSYMFSYFGYRAMKTFSLGSSFDTSNVNDMRRMFSNCGRMAMTSFSLGSTFNPSKVTDMEHMFSYLGYTALQSLSLGNFNTNSVEDMGYMFYYCGYTLMESLNLGTNFNTSNVENMSYMFAYCGYKKLTNFSFGNNFNTSKVESMSNMFNRFGYSEMKSLNLGNSFYTNNVTNMISMFTYCGATSMTILDLGPAFSNIPSTNSGFLTSCGKENEIVIYCGEAIYSDANNLKINSSSDTKINYTRGTINAKYAPKWTKESVTIKDGTMEIGLKGAIDYAGKIGDIKLAETEIDVYVDGKLAGDITKKLSDKPTLTEETNTINYTLTLSGFEEKQLQEGKDYLEWSGDVSLKINAKTVEDGYGFTDSSGNEFDGNQNFETTIEESDGSMFMDSIKPQIRYTYSSSDIDYEGKIVTVKFDAIDKYISDTELSLDDLTIQIDGQTPDFTKVERALRVESDITDTNGNVIGKSYKLTLSGLDQTTSGEGLYADYSGVVTIDIKEGAITDTKGNGNIQTTLTIGLSKPIPNPDVETGEGVVVDVVDPIWEATEIATDAINQTSTFKLRGTDKYYKVSYLTKDKIKVYVNGQETTTEITKTLSTAEPLNEERSVNGTTKTVQYGVEYTLTIEGFASDANQVSIEIEDSTLEDGSENLSKTTKIFLYNCLKSNDNLASDFLGMGLTRNEIKSVTFVDNISEAPEIVDDVSAQGDNSIIAWTYAEDDTGYHVYIGSNYQIYANQNSGGLFANCQWIEYINNLNLLNTSNVTDMSYMFYNCGYNTMTSLDLENKFDTSNVIDMSNMFDHCGYTAMTSLNLGNSFDTSSVTNMSSMFSYCGGTAMTSLNLGNSFDTSSVTNMSYMFSYCGETAMTSLDLGNSFDTSSVTNMSNMFDHCGYTAMTSLNLGNSFDTSSVTDMYYMFFSCGNMVMKSLDLGDKFDTSSVTTMTNMFGNCGSEEMTSLDLGPAFTNIPTANETFVSRCGKSGSIIIYCGEAIYSDINNFKLNSSSTETIKYTRGTINPIYSPIWQEESVLINNDKTVEILVSAIIDYEDSVDTNKITLGGSNVKVYIDGELADDIKKEVDNVAGTVYSIKLSEFEQSQRQDGKPFKEWSGNIKVVIDRGTVQDSFGNGNLETTIEKEQVTEPTDNTAFADFISPEIKYTYSETTTNIDKTQKTLTVKIDVVDKYFLSNDLEAGDIIVEVDGDTAANNKVKKEITAVEDITYNEKIVGKTYTLVISNLEQAQKEAGDLTKDYSGIVTLTIPEGTETNEIFKDTSGNRNIETTITIGINKPDTTPDVDEEGIIVDVVDPIWKISNATKGSNKVTVDLIGTDKYYASNTLTEDSITIYIDGTEIKTTENVIKSLGNAEILTDTNENSSRYGKPYGVKYTLTLSNFEEALRQQGKLYKEWSGTITLKIDGDTLKDESQNVNKEMSVPLEVNFADFIKPEIEKISSAKGTDTETIVFRITDKYFDKQLITDEELKNKIQVNINGVKADSITKELTSKEITETRNNVEYTIGKEYTLVLSKFEQTQKQEGKLYKEWSGDVTIDIPEGVVQDTSENKNETETLEGDFIDFIKPEFVYEASEISYTDKTLRVDFYAVDKYFSSSALEKTDITIEIDGDSTVNSKVDKTLTKTEDITVIVDGNSKKIGERYRLLIENFEQAIPENAGDIRDYSGIVTLTIPQGTSTNEILKDTSDNRNIDTTITVKVESTDDIVDVVDPVWKTTNVVLDRKNNQIKVDLIGTDKYYKTNTLSIDKITVKVDGEEITTNRKSLTAAEELTSGTSKYGVKYTLTLSNFEEDSRRGDKLYKELSGNIEIDIDEKTLEDTSGNTNKPLETPFNIGLGDFISPEIEKISATTNADGTQTIIFRVTDKYFKTSSITKENIIVKVDGEETSSIVKSLDSEDIKETRNETEYTIGKTYTLTLSSFEQESRQDNKDYKEWSGNVEIVIPKETVEDSSGNKNKTDETIEGAFIDFIKPEVEKVSSEVNNKTETIKFRITDKYFKEAVYTDEQVAEKIIVKIDGVQADSIKKSVTSEILTDTNGKNYGIEYTLVLSEFEQTQRQTDKQYKEWSGNVTIDIPEGLVRDTKQAVEETTYNVNDGATIAGDFVDFIKPELTYIYSEAESGINYSAKTLTVEFDLIDKYFSSSALAAEDIIVSVAGDAAANDKVKKTLTEVEDVKADGKTIGKKYNLLIENLEQAEPEYIDELREYSGIVTLTIKEGTESNEIVKDIAGNRNPEMSLTIGINAPDNSTDVDESGKIVDVVDPIWQKTDSDISREKEEVYITLHGTDKYFKESLLTEENIIVKVDGVQAPYISKKLTTETKLEGDVDGANAQYGVEYVLTLGAFTESDNGYEDYCGVTTIEIDGGTLVDNDGNKNEKVEINVGNPSHTGIFKDGIVDFISPNWKYEQEYLKNYEDEIVAVWFKGLDIQFDYDRTLSKEEIQSKIKILLDSQDVTSSVNYEITNAEQVTDGKKKGYKYELLISGFSKSGEVQIELPTNVLWDTSDYINQEQVTLDMGVVDFVHPEWSKKSSSIDRQKDEVQVVLKASDRYLDYDGINLSNNDIKVYLDGQQTTQITKNLGTKSSLYTEGENNCLDYTLTLSNFGDYSGPVSIEVAGQTIKDITSNGIDKDHSDGQYNVNEDAFSTSVKDENWVESGDNSSSPNYTAFREGVVDFIDPVIEKTNSSIDRQAKTVTVNLKATDKYLSDILSPITEDDITVYVDGIEAKSINKELTKSSIYEENGLKAVDYTLKLGKFETYDGVTTIRINKSSIRDTSGNAYSDILETAETNGPEINVGNENWVETGDDGTNPEYTAFRNGIVDFIKPVITYEYSTENFAIDYTNKTFTFGVNITDNNYKPHSLQTDEFEISIDGKTQANSNIQKTIVGTTNITSADGTKIGEKYLIKLTNIQQETITQLYKDYSGKVKINFKENMAYDTSMNKTDTTELEITNNTDSIVDVVDPIWELQDVTVNRGTVPGVNDEVVVKLNATDKYFKKSTFTKDVISILYEGKDVTDNVELEFRESALKDGQLQYGVTHELVLKNLELSGQFKLVINADTIEDNYGNKNEEVTFDLGLIDVVKPVWKYIDNSSDLKGNTGTVSIVIEGTDKYFSKSLLQKDDISVMIDGEEISVNKSLSTGEKIENGVRYTLTLSNITVTGAVTVTIPEGILLDTSNNSNNNTTITFSPSAIGADNYTTVKYFAKYGDEEGYAYVNELMNIDETGNQGSSYYTPSSITEIWNDGKNETFAEEFKYENGTQTAKSFKAWAVADENGNITGSAEFGLNDEIPSDVKYLRAVWQDAKVIFVKSSGSDSADGLSPQTAVASLEIAYSKLSTSGTRENQIIVVCGPLEWSGSTSFDKPATITNKYDQTDYRDEGAYLNISNNIYMGADLAFDNIELKVTSDTISNTDYLYNGTYSNILVANYYNLYIGRGISTQSGYTFGAIVGGALNNSVIKTGNIEKHEMIIESGKYNAIIGSDSTNTSNGTIYIKHDIQLGSKKHAVSGRNDYLNITGYFMLGQGEQSHYAYGSQSVDTAYLKDYANITIYSGTFTGENSWNKDSANTAIYLRTLEGTDASEGIVNFKMYGGQIGSINSTNVVAGARDKNIHPDSVVNKINFYRATINGNVFGQGINETWYGTSEITIKGETQITGNVYGASNVTKANSGYGEGDTKIEILGNAKITGSVFGGSKGPETYASSNGYINGSTNIIISSGKITENVYGSGENAGNGTYNTSLTTTLENSGSTNITLNGGTIEGNVFGGAYKHNVGGGTSIQITSSNAVVKGNVYGGCDQTGTISCTDSDFFKNSSASDTFKNSTINITNGTIEGSVYGGGTGVNTSVNGSVTLQIGTESTKPTIKGTIYGGAQLGSVENTIINFVNTEVTNVFGGGYNSNTENTTVNLLGGTATNVYGGSENGGTTTVANVIKTSEVETTNIFGGGYNADVTISNVNIENSVGATNVYGGSNAGGTVTKSNVNLKQGTTNVAYGGGYRSDVITSNVNVTGGTAKYIYGGSNQGGTTAETNVLIESGTVRNIYAGGMVSEATTTNVNVTGGDVQRIYGGSRRGNTTQSNINLEGGTVTTVWTAGTESNIENAVTKANGATIDKLYGGNYISGTVNNSEVYLKSGTIRKVLAGGYNTTGETINNVTVNVENEAKITSNLYAGGESTVINSSSGDTSNVTLNIVGGTINGNIYGGGYNNSVLNGNVTINIGYNAANNTNLTKGNINIVGNIYGAGYAGAEETEYTSVTKDSNIHINGTGYNSSSDHTLDLSNNLIFGEGDNTVVGGTSNITIDNFGTYETNKIIKAIQYADNVTISNSQVEFLGVANENNTNKETNYTFNRIGNLKIKNGTYIYLRRGFNLVQGFSSMVDIDGTETLATKDNTDNRIYTYESINLILSSEEYSKNTQITNFGEVKGMTFYGLYGYNRTTNKKEFGIYDPQSPADNGKFVIGTYIEGKHTDDPTVNGFYTNTLVNNTINETYITPTPDNANYHDWILGEKTYKEEITMVAKRLADSAQETITLDELYKPGSTYDIRAFSINSLDTDITVVNKSQIPKIQSDATKANTTFGLSMENAKTGWITDGETNFYIANNKGTYSGTNQYISDDSEAAPVMNLSLYNSLNITKNRDCGLVDILFEVRVINGEDISEGGIYKYSITVNIQTSNEMPEGEFLTDTYITAGHEYGLITSQECHISNRSSMTASYTVYPLGEFLEGDYRAITSTCILPEKTQITMIDYVQEIVYYYEVGSSYDDMKDGKYIYKLSNFKEIGSTANYYNNPNNTYKNAGYEEYKFILDFKNTTTDNLSGTLQLEILDGSLNTMKNTYINSNKFNIYNSKAEMQLAVEGDGNDYENIQKTSLQFAVTSDIIMKTVGSNTVQDTYYDDKKQGLSIELYNSEGRVSSDKLKGLNIVIDGQNYYPDSTGVTRIYLSDNITKIGKNITMNIESQLLATGDYKIRIGTFASYDGKFFGQKPDKYEEIDISIIGANHALKASIDENTKVIDKVTGINLAGTDNLDFSIETSDLYNTASIKVSLYKRDITYGENTDKELEYKDITYTLVDLQDYTTDTLVSAGDSSSYEYLVADGDTISSITNFKIKLKQNLRAGSYKLEFKLYNDDICVNTVKQHIIITD